MLKNGEASSVFSYETQQKTGLFVSFKVRGLLLPRDIYNLQNFLAVKMTRHIHTVMGMTPIMALSITGYIFVSKSSNLASK